MDIDDNDDHSTISDCAPGCLGGISNNILVDGTTTLLSFIPEQHRTTNSNTIALPLENFEPVLGMMYDHFINKIVPNGAIFNRYITHNNFVLVSKFLIKGRLDLLFRHYSRQTPANRIVISDTLVMPKCLAEMINGLGGVMVNQAGLTVYPTCHAEPGNVDTHAHRLVTHEM